MAVGAPAALAVVRAEVARAAALAAALAVLVVKVAVKEVTAVTVVMEVKVVALVEPVELRAEESSEAVEAQQEALVAVRVAGEPARQLTLPPVVQIPPTPIEAGTTFQIDMYKQSSNCVLDVASPTCRRV